MENEYIESAKLSVYIAIWNQASHEFALGELAQRVLCEEASQADLVVFGLQEV